MDLPARLSVFGLYITHPQVKIDPAIPVPMWGLSEIGAARARMAAGNAWAQRLRRIVSSEETKAIETADILAAAAGLDVEIAEAMHENDRSATGFLPPPEFEERYTQRPSGDHAAVVHCPSGGPIR